MTDEQQAKIVEAALSGQQARRCRYPISNEKRPRTCKRLFFPWKQNRYVESHYCPVCAVRFFTEEGEEPFRGRLELAKQQVEEQAWLNN